MGRPAEEVEDNMIDVHLGRGEESSSLTCPRCCEMACWWCPADELHIQTAQAECDLLTDRQVFVYSLPRFPETTVCLSKEDKNSRSGSTEANF